VPVYLSLTARLCVGCGVAASLAYMTTPVAIAAARRFAFYDTPVGYKGHARATPYLGGTAVMLAFVLAAAAAAGQLDRTAPLLAGVAVLVVLGTVDDRITVSPGLRVAVELALGAALGLDGLGWQLGSGPLVDALVTAAWVAAIVNAFNLFDNMDGAASTMALVVSAGTCVLALVTGATWVAAGSAALCGACIGFLPHNLCSPARIFLGDGGSMPLGFAIAVLSAGAARSAEPSSLALLVGFLLVGIPALDTSLVIVSRTRRGISVLTGGRDHLTHRTRQRLRTPGRVALVLGGAQAVVSALVIVASRQSSSALVYVVLAFLVFAAAAIVALEDAFPIEIVQSSVGTAEARAAGARAGRDDPSSVAGTRAPRGRSRHAPRACLAAIGLAGGLSPLFSAYYATGLWVTMGLVVVVAATVATIARPPQFTLPVVLALVGLAGLGLWSLLSMTWAAAVEPAGTDANLWLTYAALFLLAVTLLRDDGDSTLLLGAAGVGIAVVALTVIVRLLGSDPAALFISGRLNSPLGYINGEGCIFAMGVWPAVALAERRRAPVAGLGAGIAVAMAGLALLSQSRGAAIATAAAALIAVVAIPGTRRRIIALAFVAAGLATAAAPVVRAYSAAASGSAPAVVIHHAVLAIVASAVAAGVAWAAVVALTNLAAAPGDAAAGRVRRAGTVAAVILVLAPAAVAAVRARSIERTARAQWHAFVHLSETAQSPGASVQTRLFSGAGNRYDYWRVAWHVFADHPLVGVGAGNYTQYYFRLRQTQEAIQNPHSLELQTLSELGIVGALLLAMLVVGVVLGARNLRRRARQSVPARGLMVAAAGSVVVWLVDTSGDWMALLPGVTAVALCGAAVLCRPGPPVGEIRRHGRLPLLAAAAATFVLAVSGASLLRAGLSIRFLDDARAALTHDPAGAIRDAGNVLSLDPANLDAFYVEAAGQARFDRAAAARRILLQATQEDPASYVTWTLLGDLETRAGDLVAAKSYYRHALTLDPREPGLAALAADPTLQGG
jgi:UDP-GlcNAc:undecaprenyl-phosphate GlcNAc-1-phosphate transferase